MEFVQSQRSKKRFFKKNIFFFFLTLYFSTITSPNVAKSTIDIMEKCKTGSSASNLQLSGWGGESGSLMVIVPGVAGFAVYGPLLSDKGITARGTRLINAIASQYKL